MVGTSKEYVWKETSRCRKSTTATGLVLSRKTTQLSKRKNDLGNPLYLVVVIYAIGSTF